MSRRSLPYALAAVLVAVAATSFLVVWQLGLQAKSSYRAVASATLPLPVASVPPGEVAAELLREAPPSAEIRRLQGIELLDASQVPPSASAAPRIASPRLAIIVAGIGLARAKSERALMLPPAVTLAVSPYAEDVGGWLDRIRAGGHEAALLVPLAATEPSRVDNGPLALQPRARGAELEKGLVRMLSQAREPFILAGEAGAFGENPAAAKTLVQLLKARNLALVELSGDRLAAPAKAVGLAYGASGEALDATPEGAAIDAALGRLEGKALDLGTAIGWVEGIPTAIDRLHAWAVTLSGKGLELVPVGALLGDPAVMGVSDAP